ncbi:MAG TPA: nuclear transport factor 2 family protein, partial [Kofleriaceae bacterium]|nr:nuclear transport factor 2 family protein [Kofleriaceae bacterium]
MADRLEILARHLAAENGHDVDGIMATYTPSPVVTVNGRAIAGTDRVRVFHERFGFGGAGAFSDVEVVERHRHVTPDAVAIEQTLRGRHTGDWEGLASTGKRF